jgi:protein O-GlcNAc transferase
MKKPAAMHQIQPPADEVNTLLALYNGRRYAEAESRAHALLGRYPKAGFVWKLLGILLYTQGKDPLLALQKTAQLLPNDAGVHNNLGSALQDRGQFEDAAACYRRALKLKPDFAIAHRNLGSVLVELGQLDGAVASFRRAVKFRPDFAEAHSNLGNALHELGQFETAAASCRKAVELQPDFAIAHYNLGNALIALGQLDAAVASYRRAVELKPDLAEAYSNLGYALQELGQLDAAAACCHRAVELKPDFAEAHNNLGNTLKALGQLDGAVASYRRAVELKPDFAFAHNNLGLVLQALGQPGTALASYRRALEIKPDYADAYGNMLYMHAFTRDIPPETECSLAADWEKIALSKSERIAARDRTFDHPPRAGRKLRVGVVSAELGQHPVAEFLEPILEHLDRSRFHVTLFPTSARTEPRAARFRELADEYTSLVGLSDEQAADQIRSGRIDILIDTTSHMRGCRLGIFARRAAPVQCHYIGYHGTTGLTEMDWFIADAELLPPGYDSHFRENIWRLPRLRLAYKGDPALPESRWTPSPDGTIRLGSFNNLTKVREEALALWAKVMNAIPESKLLLKDRLAQDPAVQNRIRTELGRHGISAGRVEFAAPVPDWSAHMVLYDRLDIALDAIPLNSETTAFDALWMGVPLVALEGNWVGGRMASTILKALGKPEWIAHSDDEYVAIVAALAHDVQGRKALRATQRALISNSPLCDAEGLTRALEDAFGAMFDRWLEKRESVRQGHVAN